MSAITCLIGKAAKGLVDLNEANQIKVLYEKHYNELAEQVAEGGLESTTAAKTLAELMKNQEGLSQSLKSKLSNWGAQRMSAQKTLAVLNAQAGSKINKMVTTARAKASLEEHFGPKSQIDEGVPPVDMDPSATSSISSAAKKEGDSFAKTQLKIWEYNEASKDLVSSTQRTLLAPMRDQLGMLSPNKFGVYSADVYNLEADMLKAKYKQPTSEFAKTFHDNLIDTIRAGNNQMREVGYPIVDPSDARMPIHYDPRNVKKNPELFKQLLQNVDTGYLNKQIPETLGISMDHIADLLIAESTNTNFGNRDMKRLPLQLIKRFLTFNDQGMEETFNKSFKQSHLFEDILNLHNDTAGKIVTRQRYGTNFEEVAKSTFDSKIHSSSLSNFAKYLSGEFADHNPDKLTAAINSYGKPLTAVAQLGGTPLQALTSDPVTSAFTAAMTWGGLPDKSFGLVMANSVKEGVGTFLRTFGRTLFASRDSFRTELSKAIVILEHFNDRILSESRNIEGLVPSKFGGFLYNGFSVMAYLQNLTQKSQFGSVYETLMHLGGYVGKSFDSIPTGAKEDLINLGLTKELWERITPSDLTMVRKNPIVSLNSLVDRGETKLANILGAFVDLEKERFVPTRSAVASAGIAQLQKNAGFGKPVIAATMQYSGWVLSVWQNQVLRMAKMFDGTFQGGGKALGAITAFGMSLTVMDGIYRQLINLANGKDPESMNNEEFWKKSALRSVPIPFVSMVVDNFLSTSGNSTSSNTFGPVGSLIRDVSKVTDAFIDKGAKQGAMTAFDKASTYVPGNNIWYLVGAYKNLIVPTLKKYLFGQDAIKAMNKKAERERKNGTTRFYDPNTGNLRAPDLSKAFDTTPKPKGQRGRPRKSTGI